MKIVNQEKGITVLLDKPSREGEFKFDGLYLNNNPDTIYKKYVWGYDKKEADKIYIDLLDYIYDKMKEIADSQLKVHIDQNISNMSFYTQKDKYGYYEFFSESPIFDYPKIQKDITVYLNDITEGIVNCKINNRECVFDLIKDRFTKIKPTHGYEREYITALNVIYGYEFALNKLVALEQYKKGIAHKTYTELVNLKKFFDGKKSIKIKLKSGQVIEYKSDHYGINFNQIMHLQEDRYFIHDSYDMKPRPSKIIDLSELECFQYGKNTYKLNIENLIIE